MRESTVSARRRLYLLARVVVERHYRRRELTLELLARGLASSPRQLQRAYAQFGGTTFSEDLLRRRMRAGAQLLVEQRAIAVEDVARLVGYSQGTHFARAFRRRYGVSPARFREAALQADERSYALDSPPPCPSSSASPSSAPSPSGPRTRAGSTGTVSGTRAPAAA
ncbi:MAG TPA: helix-turn-helix transcriptional regulator [Solirubrobacteraceae bacterium]|nr:helix-turn-helix transcriptional regulator [Solirubrobacteraceae bacterium]